ncbi:MAG: O-antigen polymerase [Candidatus Helarchaeota archaeon]
MQITKISISTKQIEFYKVFIILSLVAFLTIGIVRNNYFIIIGFIGIGIFLFLFRNLDKTIYLLILSIMFIDWLSEKLLILPRHITWIPELISSVVLLFILFKSSINKRIPMKAPYILIYVFIILTFIGIVLNNVGLPIAIAGIRNHLKFIPFFLLPFYFNFSNQFMNKFFKVIMFFAFLQCPVAILQRILYQTASGDPVGGTLGAFSSGTLSVFCSMIIIFWTVYYFKLSMRTRNYILGLIALMIPMSLNETKITLFLIPIILISIYLFIPESKLKFKSIVFIGVIVVSLLGIYRVIYNNYYGRSSRKIENYILKPEKSLEYIYYRKYLENGELNRIPKIIFAYENVNRNISHFLFGVGAGNASDSFFSNSVGYYYSKYMELRIDGVFAGYMIWEYGFLGTALFFLIIMILFKKSYDMKRLKGINGVIASGFLGMSIIIFISTFYFDALRLNIFGYMYWFVAGYLMNLFYYKENNT